MKIPDEIPWRATGDTLGSGGQGQVQLVTRRDEPAGHQFALKELSNTASRQARQRFQREIEVVKNLNHPSIVRIVDHSEAEDDFQFYVMEYHEGASDLEKVLFSDRNPYHGKVGLSIDLFEQIILAIGVCENANPKIVHRDISPKNVLVLPDYSIRLIDFGICQIEKGTSITLTGENFGTRYYTSPECELGQDSSIGIHSDIYSAAKVLWSAVTSKRAFSREASVFADQSMESLFPLNKETWHLMNIFERSIREKPENRFRSTQQVLNEIAEIKYLLRGGFPPLKDVLVRCPSCGSQKMQSFSEGSKVFGNPNPTGVMSWICGICGFAFVRNMEVWNSNVRRMEGLD